MAFSAWPGNGLLALSGLKGDAWRRAPERKLRGGGRAGSGEEDEWRYVWSDEVV